MSSAPKSTAIFECVFEARRSSRANAGESLRRSRGGFCVERGLEPGMNFSRFCGMKFGRPSLLRASFAFTASRRVVGRRSDSTGRSYSRVVRVSRSFTNFSARDGGLDAVRFAGRASRLGRSVFGERSVRSDFSVFAFGAMVFWKRDARSFDRSRLRASFLETVAGSISV